MTIVTRVKEVKDVIHTVVEIANNRGSAGQNRATLETDEVDAAGGCRSVANNSHFVEFFKHLKMQSDHAVNKLKDHRISTSTSKTKKNY